LLSNFGNHKYYIPGLYGNLIQVLDLGTAITIGEQIAVVDKVPTTAHKDRANTEYQLSESAEVNKLDESDTTSETIDNDEIWADTVSRQSLKQHE
jgi:hypothetical protein